MINFKQIIHTLNIKPKPELTAVYKYSNEKKNYTLVDCAEY